MPLLNCWILITTVCISHQQFNLLVRNTSLSRRCLSSLLVHCLSLNGYFDSLIRSLTFNIFLLFFCSSILTCLLAWCLKFSWLILRSWLRMRLQSLRLIHPQFHKTILWYANSKKLSGYGLLISNLMQSGIEIWLN